MNNAVERPFSCGVCSAAYKHKKHLVHHAKVAHGGYRVACDECGATFGKKGDLRRHTMTIHRPMPMQPANPAFRPAEPTPGSYSASDAAPLPVPATNRSTGV